MATKGDSDYIIGVIVAVVGNIAVSFSYQFQKLAHKNNVEKKPYTSLPLWWLGLSLMLGGEVGNFLAYGWAPATVHAMEMCSVVSPLGAASVVANALLAHVLLKEYLTRRNCFGVALAILGSVVISLTAPVTIIDPVEVQGSNYIFVSLVKPRALIFLVLVVVASVLLANPCGMRQLVSAEYRSTHIWANCMMCGLLGCITVMGAKGVSTAFTELINGEFGMWVGPECWLTYVLVVSAIGSIIGQVNFLNRAMMCFDASDVVPVYFVLFTLCTVSTGMVLYLEIKFKHWAQAVGFVLAILGTFGGVYLIQNGKKSGDAEEDPEAAGGGERSAQYRAKDDAARNRYFSQEEEEEEKRSATLGDDGMGIGLELDDGNRGSESKQGQRRARAGNGKARKDADAKTGVSRQDLRQGGGDGEGLGLEGTHKADGYRADEEDKDDGNKGVHSLAKRPSATPIGWGSPKRQGEGGSASRSLAGGVLGAAVAGLATAGTAAAAGTAAGMVELAAAAGLGGKGSTSTSRGETAYAIYESEDEGDEQGALGQQPRQQADEGDASISEMDVEDLSGSEHLLTHTSAAPSCSAADAA